MLDIEGSDTKPMPRNVWLESVNTNALSLRIWFVACW
jgi:hypothetical protein